VVPIVKNTKVPPVTTPPVTDAETSNPLADNPRTEPLLVTVRDAQRLLKIGKTHVFDLLNKGVLERRKVGKATRITMRSIRNVAGL